MPGIIYILIMWFVISFIRKAAQKGKGGKSPQRSAQKEPARARQPMPTVRQVMKETAPAPEPPRAREALANGESAQDEEGCVGGSLPHGEHEGDYAPGSLGGFARGAAPRRAKRQEADASAVAESPGAAISAEQLRAAVVMAEVLNKPVSMRRRMPGGRA